MIDGSTASPADRRTVDRSVVSSRAAAAIPRVRVRLSKGRPVFRLAAGGPAAALAESPSAATEPAPARDPLSSFRHAMPANCQSEYLDQLYLHDECTSPKDRMLHFRGTLQRIRILYSQPAFAFFVA